MRSLCSLPANAARIALPFFARSLFALPFFALAGCVTVPITGNPAAPVYARGETTPVGTADEDAADDPAIWRNDADPAASLIVATDKKAGLYVYGLDGQTRSFAPGGRLNNVDLVDMGAAGIIVAASDRNDPARAKIRLYRLDPVTARLDPLGSVDGGMGEAYGLCLSMNKGALHAFSVLKDGAIGEYRIDLAPNIGSALVRSLSVPSQAEGCVVDPRNGTFYVGEENAGIWRFVSGAQKGDLVAAIDNRQLVADVEGLALSVNGPADGSDRGWLVASSQGDNAFALYRLPDFAPAGRFRIAQGAFGGVEETDGIALDPRDFGAAYPNGLFVAQDGINAPDAQNFKLVSWGDVRAAMAKPDP